ncbi:DUF3618 domain-containing protein [Nocardioides sp. C4-1]|uniref:DUF3618 domain-containing protein n=1 Tax=Nocardioides sp. C4-1 TaxID=3151851 RepID=UPI00326490E0
MSESEKTQTPEQIQADIEKTRADLAATVDQLGERLHERKQQVVTGATYAGAAVGAVIVVLVVVKIVKKVRA